MRTPFRDRISSYLRHHRGSSVETVRRLRGSPVQSFLTSLVIAIALALPATLYVGVDNLQQLNGSFESSARMSLFLDRAASEKAIKDLVGELRANTDIAEVQYIGKEQALEEFKASSGFGDVLAMLDENPLPPVILVTPAMALENDLGAVEVLISSLQKHALVKDVSLDMKWLQRLQALLDIGRRIALALGVALGLGVLLVVGNTIRLAIENRRDEILVVKLVGGTNAYVRRPFLYTGIWFGVGGGLLAWLLVFSGLLWLEGAVQRLSLLYHSRFSLQGLGFTGLLVLVAIGGLLGLMGAWLAVSRQLSRIEPR